MFRSSFLFFTLTLFLTIALLHGNIHSRRKRQLSSSSSSSSSSTRKPVSVKICGAALVRMLDMICTKARQLLMKNEKPSPPTPSPPAKRQLHVEDDPFSHTLSVTDYAQFNNTLVGDCCLQACTLKTLLKYC